MEKKGSRSVQPSPKGAVTDNKKNQDNAGGKLQPRGSRRREPSSGTYPAKNETSRKSYPQQRNKPIFNKQPRSRGYNPGFTSRREETGLEEYEPEIGSVMQQGSKKQSLNHLLNFQLAPHVSQYSGGSSSITKLNRWNTHKHKYNKEEFLQANCQFVVKSSGDYKKYMNNQDALVDWDLIEQINIQVVETPSCPICLYPPVAAKMTRCGHIYCWSCVLHYLALSEKTWSKCPICYEAIHKKDLKSVVTIMHPPFNINETITFQLMKKTQGSLIAHPIGDNVVEQDVPLKLSAAKSNTYCKLLLGDKSDVLNIIEREKQELALQLLDDENVAEKCFIEEAVSLLNERERNVLHEIEMQFSNVDKGETIKTLKESFNSDSDQGMERSCEQLKNISVDGSDKRQRMESISSESSSCTSETKKVLYFYQVSDGQHMYLHSINAKMLEHTYDSIDLAPKTITGKILEKESFSMTEELRKRFKHLQHLPITCPFEIVEINLNQPIISKETKTFFQDTLHKRQKRRQSRAREERQREKRIAEEENRKMGRFPAANLKLESHFQFPTMTEELPALGNQDFENPNAFSNPPLGDTEPSSSTCELTNNGPSFAKMLSSATKKSTGPAWPQIKQKTERETETRKLINVTGSQMKTNYRRITHKSDSEPECEDYEAPPTFNTSLMESLEVALQRANSDKGEPQTRGGKKKKKNKHQVLFSTSMSYQ